MLGLLVGKTVNLRVVEKEDLPLLADWFNDLEVLGQYNTLRQMSRTEAQNMFDNVSDMRFFLIEKKDGTKIGFIGHFHVLHLGTGTKQVEVGYTLLPAERGKGHGTEALRIIVDYLFLSKEIMRIQAQTDRRNLASQKILEKAGFKNEGILRNNFFIRGEWTDDCMYSIIREDWNEPKIL